MKFDKVIIECSPFLRTMMTAGQIALELAVPIVTINYRATELMKKGNWYFEKNPMNKIEFTKYKYDFEVMQKEVPQYSTEEFFPNGVKFQEPPNDKYDYKKEIYEAFPESDG